MLLVVAVPAGLACALVASRVGADARFVTWPVLAFTVLAASVALVGVATGLAKPQLVAAGLLPAAVLSYFLPAVPLPVLAAVLVGLGSLAAAVRGLASGAAALTGALMIVFVVLQRPAVECSETGVSTTSGPWWIDEASSTSGSGQGQSNGAAVVGVVQVGKHHYEYVCQGSRLERFERSTSSPDDHRVDEPVPPVSVPRTP